MKQKKKNGFFTFCCSFVPGLAEMYMGFMKMGASLLLLFMLSFVFPTILNASDVFIVFGLGMWAFGFFHARNISHMDDEEFNAYEDRYVWDELTNNNPAIISKKLGTKGIAAILIFLGISLLWGYLFDIVSDIIPNTVWNTIYPIVSSIPGMVIAVIIIIIGVKMIKGKKEELLLEDHQNS